MPRARLNPLNMISILGIFSHSKLQTSPEAMASSWGLAARLQWGSETCTLQLYCAIYLFYVLQICTTKYSII